MRRVAVLMLAMAGMAAAQTYAISTIAGGGGPEVGGFSTATGGYTTTGVLVSAAGNVYVSLCGVVSQVVVFNSMGLTQQVIGAGPAGFGDGPASAAQLNCPAGLALDSGGNLYIADSINHRIRKVTASNGLVTTIAGNGTQGYNGDNISALNAALNTPEGLAVDSSGNLYIADTGNHRIRKVAASSGTITTFAGNGTFGYNGDNIAAVSAELNSPEGLAVDAAGNIYLADEANHRIRRIVAATGIITTVAGNGTMGYNGDNITAVSAELSFPGAVAVDSVGNLNIADIGNGRIRKVTASTGVIVTAAGNGTQGYNGDGFPAVSSELNEPASVAVDGSGNLYIADEFNFRVRKVTASTGIMTTIAGNGFESYSGDAGLATSAMLSDPTGAAVDSAGNLYLADQANHRIRKVTVATGVITTIAGNGSSGYNGDGIPALGASLSFPQGVVVDSGGNLYIADTSNHRIRMVTASTGIITTVAGNGTLGYNGDNISATAAELNNPYGLALDNSGNLYIADSLNNLIRKVDLSSGMIMTVAGNAANRTAGYLDNIAATSGSLDSPTGVAVDGGGSLYIADSGNNLIRKVTASTGMITSVAGNSIAGYNGDNIAATSSELDSAVGIAIDGAANLYLADSGNNRLRKVTASTGIITTLAGDGSFGYNWDTGAASGTEIADPEGVAVDSSGNLYLADAGNNRIRKLTLPATVGTPPVLTIVASHAANFAQGDIGDSYAITVTNIGLGATSAAVIVSDALPIGLTATALGGSGWSCALATLTCTRSDALAPRASYPAITLTVNTAPNAPASVTNTANVSGGGGSGSSAMNLTAITPMFALNPASNLVSAAAYNGSAALTEAAGGLWTILAAAIPAWLTVSPMTGTGSATLNYNVTANNGGARTGSFTVLNGIGQVAAIFTITQGGGGCAYTLSSASVSVGTDGVNGQMFAVTTDSTCNWTVSMPGWLAAYPLSGTGSGTITYSVYPNFSANARSGNITVGSSHFAVAQGGDSRTSDQRFVRLCYFNFFGRLPSQSELDFQVSQGVIPQGRTEVALNFFNSAEFNAGGRYVAGLYTGILGRDADYNGWLFQRNALAGGFTNQMGALTAFITSTEYQAKYGNLSGAGFVTVLYQNILQRTPSASDLAFQMAAAQQYGRVQVAYNLLTSGEFQTDSGPRLTAFLLYACLLQRDPSPSDLNATANQLSAGATLQSLIAAFIASAEFTSVF